MAVLAHEISPKLAEDGTYVFGVEKFGVNMLSVLIVTGGEVYGTKIVPIEHPESLKKLFENPDLIFKRLDDEFPKPV